MYGDQESIWEGDGVRMVKDDADVMEMSWFELRCLVAEYNWYTADGALTAEDCPQTLVALV